MVTPLATIKRLMLQCMPNEKKKPGHLDILRKRIYHTRVYIIDELVTKRTSKT